jgi:hypothetical protein
LATGDESVLQSLCAKRELRKGCYRNRRTRIRTSTIIIRAKSRPPESERAAAVVPEILYSFCAHGFLSCSLAVGAAFRRPPSISVQDVSME